MIEIPKPIGEVSGGAVILSMATPLYKGLSI